MDNLPGQLSLFVEDPEHGPLMTIEEMKQHKWHISWSGGKDSTATIITCHELGVPVEKITYIRMMYDETLPATLPIMVEFVDKAAETFRAWGYNVQIIKSERTAISYANQIYYKSKYPERNEKKYGVAQFMRGHCKFQRTKEETVLHNSGEWSIIGYAADEKDRLHRLGGKTQSVLASAGINEADTYTICKKYNLLSPLYGTGIERDGCWFCPNANKRERERLKAERPDLYKKIIELIEMSDFDLSFQAYRNHWLDDYLKERDQTTLF